MESHFVWYPCGICPKFFHCQPDMHLHQLQEHQNNGQVNQNVVQQERNGTAVDHAYSNHKNSSEKMRNSVSKQPQNMLMPEVEIIGGSIMDRPATTMLFPVGATSGQPSPYPSSSSRPVMVPTGKPVPSGTRTKAQARKQNTSSPKQKVGATSSSKPKPKAKPKPKPKRGWVYVGPPDQKRFRCIDCPKQYSTKDAYFNHVHAHMNGFHQCSGCLRMFEEAEEFTVHSARCSKANSKGGRVA